MTKIGKLIDSNFLFKKVDNILRQTKVVTSNNETR